MKAIIRIISSIIGVGVAKHKAKREAQQRAERKEAERRAALEAQRKAEQEAQQRARREAEIRKAEVKKQRNRISYNPQATYLTKEDEAELRRELKNLVEVQRPALTQALKDAAGRESKVKKNADHHYAKDQQGLVEDRIRRISTILSSAIIVEDNGPSDQVRIGSTVIIREDGTNEDEEYKIVGFAATPGRKISCKSPVGSALLGREKGSEVKVQTPGGPIKFKIVDVR